MSRRWRERCSASASAKSSPPAPAKPKSSASSDKSDDPVEQATAHRVIDLIKPELGERGPLWRTDGAPTSIGIAVKNTSRAKWYSGFEGEPAAQGIVCESRLIET